MDLYKVCTRCHQKVRLSEFRPSGRESGVQGPCRKCESKLMSQYQSTKAGKKARKIYVARCRSKKYDPIVARRELQNAVAAGTIIKPKHCSVCLKRKKIIEGHHDDYRYPLKVKWLCTLCHGKRDSLIRSKGLTNVQRQRLRRGWPIDATMAKATRSFVRSGITHTQFVEAAKKGVSLALLRYRMLVKKLTFKQSISFPVKTYIPFAVRITNGQV